MQNSKIFNNIKGSVLIVFAALLWGLAFVAQSKASESIKPFFFNGIRSFVGALFLLLLWIVLRLIQKKPIILKSKSEQKKSLLAGFLCGIFLTFAVNFQQVGIYFYPDGVAVEARGGFITALYVIFVPLFAIFLKRIPHPIIWLASIVALSGVFFLCFSNGFSGVYFADLMIFLCAITFTIHIYTIDHFQDVNGILLSMLQFTFVGIFSMIISLIFEGIPTLPNFNDALPSILYCGIVSSGIAYTLQIISQQIADPSILSIGMSFESVFAALGGWIILGNTLSPIEILGCVLVFVAIILAQLPQFLYKNKTNESA